MKKVRIAVFGAGQALFNKLNYFKSLENYVEVVVIIDNDEHKWGTIINGMVVCTPKTIKEYDLDGILIISTLYYSQIHNQLLEMNVSCDKIWNIDYLRKKVLLGKKIEYGSPSVGKKSILIITTDMSLAGGILVSIYAAVALKKSGYFVRIAAPSIDVNVKNMLDKNSICYTEWFSLPYVSRDDILHVEKYNKVIVSCFQMINAVYEISRVRDVVWWLHEDSEDWYTESREKFPAIFSDKWMDNVKIECVSDIAAGLFEKYFPEKEIGILPFGIPDCGIQIKKNNNKIRFGIFARLSERKGQHILLEAIKCVDNCLLDKIEILFVGLNIDKNLKYDKNELAYRCITCLGEQTHEKTLDIMRVVDVVVCPSLVESMSMTVIEGMMMGKLCVVSDNTGISKFIENNINGILFRNKDVEELARIIENIALNYDEYVEIGKEARITYEKQFSIDAFANNLETIIRE